MPTWVLFRHCHAKDTDVNQDVRTLRPEVIGSPRFSFAQLDGRDHVRQEPSPAPRPMFSSPPGARLGPPKRTSAPEDRSSSSVTHYHHDSTGEAEIQHDEIGYVFLERCAGLRTHRQLAHQIAGHLQSHPEEPSQIVVVFNDEDFHRAVIRERNLPRDGVPPQTQPCRSAAIMFNAARLPGVGFRKCHSRKASACLGFVNHTTGGVSHRVLGVPLPQLRKDR